MMSERDGRLDAMVRARIAEIMSAAGVPHGRVGLEVLYKLPSSLVQVYELLWDLSVYGEGSPEVDGGRSGAKAEVGVVDDPKNRGGGAGGRTRDSEQSRRRMGEMVVRSGGSARRGARGASRGSDGRGEAGGVEVSWRGEGGRSEGGGEGGATLGQRVAEIRSKADKRLRAVARDVAAELGELGLGVDATTGEMMVRVRRRSATGDAIDRALPGD